MKHLLFSCVVMSSVACNVHEINTPTQATPASHAVSVTVRALVYQQTNPIANVCVYADDQHVGTTNDAGEARIAIPSGREVTIRVAKDGWVALMPWAAAIVNADGETWTFYLQAVN